jgi:2-amino-4-hydroxy-6-hydroxymethyldihydropteridine diphosphokinase
LSTVYLSLGSNIDARSNISSGIEALEASFGPVGLSPVYRAPAVGFEGKDFINLVARIETTMTPVELKEFLTSLEDRHDRDRDVPKFSDRTLDIDILLYDDLVLYSPAVQIPRDEILEAAYVLRPLAELAPNVIHPVERLTLAGLWRNFPKDLDVLEAISLWPPPD